MTKKDEDEDLDQEELLREIQEGCEEIEKDLIELEEIRARIRKFFEETDTPPTIH